MDDPSKEFFIKVAEANVSLLANLNEMGDYIIHSDSITRDQKHKCSEIAANSLMLHNQAIEQVQSQFKDDVLPIALQGILDRSKENNIKTKNNIRKLKEC